MNLAQIGLILGSTSLAVFLFEIPTGTFADLVGKKASILIGVALEGATLLALFFVNNFYIIIILYFLLGISSTFFSGAEEAWVVDLLEKNKKKHLLDEYFTKDYSFHSAAMVLAGVLGAIFVKNIGISSIWIVSGIASLIAFPILLIPKEVKKKTKLDSKLTFRKSLQQVKTSVRYCYKNKMILLLFSASIFANLGYFFGDNITWFPLFQSKGLDASYFGYFFSATFLLSIFSPYIIKKLRQKIGKYSTTLMLVLLAIAIVSLSVLFFGNIVFLIALYIIFMGLWDFYGPLRPIFLQRLIPSKQRATISSTYSMVRSAIMFIAPPLVGFTADKIGTQNTIAICSIVLVPAMFFYFKMKKRETQKPPKAVEIKQTKVPEVQNEESFLYED